jgi:asparagine synthase (glutamine-hydrolysing)
LKFLPTGFLNKYLAFLDIKNFENKIVKLINFIDTDNDIELYNKMISLNSSYNLFFKKDNIDKKKFFQKKEFIGDLNTQENFMYFDQTDYLPNDILCKVDRATMYNSIESRAPFLDHKLIENSWKISLDYKINGNNGKMILKDILKDYLPNKLIKRSKTGFAIPLDDLLRTKIKLWAENIIQKKNLTTNYIDDEKVKIIWDHHKNNKINAGGILWSILVLKNWFIDN